MNDDFNRCSDCDCSSHQIRACGGCPNRVGFAPAGRPLIPGQDATPHAGKNLRVGAFVAAILLVLGAWGLSVAISLAVSA